MQNSIKFLPSCHPENPIKAPKVSLPSLRKVSNMLDSLPKKKEKSLASWGKPEPGQYNTHYHGNFIPVPFFLSLSQLTRSVSGQLVTHSHTHLVAHPSRGSRAQFSSVGFLSSFLNYRLLNEIIIYTRRGSVVLCARGAGHTPTHPSIHPGVLPPPSLVRLLHAQWFNSRHPLCVRSTKGGEKGEKNERSRSINTADAHHSRREGPVRTAARPPEKFEPFQKITQKAPPVSSLWRGIKHWQ